MTHAVIGLAAQLAAAADGAPKLRVVKGGKSA